MANDKTGVARILIVDDVDTNRFVLKDIIEKMGCMPILTENGEQALKIAGRFPLQLVISDIAMPVMDGYEFCRRMKENPDTREIPIIFISAFDNPKDVVKGFEIGGADYITKPFIPEVVRARVRVHMKVAENAVMMQELNKKMQISINEQMRQVEKEKQNVLNSIISVTRANAAYDSKYMDRLAKNCRVLAEAMQLSPDYDDKISDNYVDMIEKAAILCDIGNVGISIKLLQKKDKFTQEEREEVQKHTIIGAQILNDIEENGSGNSFIRMARDIAHFHHENWDGSGYPEGRAEEKIPLSAQIVAVAGSYTSLTEKRTYREAYSNEEAFRIMDGESGTQFNPKIYEIMKKISRQLH